MEKRLGAVLRGYRRRQELTLAEVAGAAEISAAMLSRIETGAAAATLDTLSRVVKALGISLSEVFRDMEVPQGSAQVVRHGEGMEVVRVGTRRGYTYRLLAYHQGPGKQFEPFLIEMDRAITQLNRRFEHPGTEFMYVLEGRMEYRHGDELYLLGPGDAMTFSGEIQHGPERLLDSTVRFLDIIIYGSDAAG